MIFSHEIEPLDVNLPYGDGRVDDGHVGFRIVLLVAFQPDMDRAICLPFWSRDLQSSVQEPLQVRCNALVQKRRTIHLDRHTIDQLPLLLLRTLVPEGVELLRRQLTVSALENRRACFDQLVLAVSGTRAGPT